jgi:hypothetical protein
MISPVGVHGLRTWPWLRVRTYLILATYAAVRFRALGAWEVRPC